MGHKEFELGTNISLSKGLWIPNLPYTPKLSVSKQPLKNCTNGSTQGRGVLPLVAIAKYFINEENYTSGMAPKI